MESTASDHARFATVNSGFAALVVKRMDNHFELSVAIQIENGGNVIEIWNVRRIGFCVNFTGHKLRLNFAPNYAPQDDD
jgi:hypothetical protein